MGILNYLLNQRPENRRKQELHDVEMASHQAQKDALAAWQRGGMQGPPPPLPTVSSGGAPGPGLVPPTGPGVSAADGRDLPGSRDALDMLLGQGDNLFGMTMDKGVTTPLTQGEASPLTNLADTGPNLAETLVQQSNEGPQTSLSSSYEPLKELAMLYIESGDPAAAQMGMELLTDVAAAEQGASQFDRTASQNDRGLSQMDRQLDDTDYSNVTSRMNANENSAMGRFVRGPKFDEDIRQFRENMRFGYAGLDVERERNRINKSTTNNPFGKIQPGDYTPDSLQAYYGSITTDNPFGNHSLLVPRYDASAQTQRLYTENTDAMSGANNRYLQSRDIGRRYAESTAVQGQAANASELLKDVFGTQDGITALRTRLAALRNDYTLDKLPPGVASDKDVALAMEGFIDTTTTDKDLVRSFLDGIAKVELAAYVEARFKSQFMAQRRNHIGMNEAWETQRDGILEAAFQAEGLTWDGQGRSLGGAPQAPAAPAAPASQYDDVFNQYRSGSDGGLNNPSQ